MFRIFVILLSIAGLLFVNCAASDGAVSAATVAQAVTYPIVDTGQTACYDDDGPPIACPAAGQTFYGQDAQYAGNQPSTHRRK